jgi:hypothetical protein
VIERRGTGGGNFRKMYARFLEEAGYGESALAAQAAQDWSKLAVAAREASGPEHADRAQWDDLSSQAALVLDAEQRLWEALAA